MNLRDYGERTWLEADEHYRAEILKVVPRIGGRMLDVGCDDGDWTERVRRQAGVASVAVSGIEIVPERRDLALQRGFEVVTADLESSWPFGDESFELVHANQVIEHVKRLDHFVAEIRRVLVPGGWAVICTENLSSWHNVAAAVFGYMPFSLTNISSAGPIGNPFALHAGEPITRGESWQHIHVLTLTALIGIFIAHDLVVEQTFAGGYHPLRGRAAQMAARRDPRHGHFIGIRARKAAPAA
jgi:SAM-dependent methyltransferase